MKAHILEEVFLFCMVIIKRSSVMDWKKEYLSPVQCHSKAL